tara:strand:- start:76 stop:633 length:558 start_codon:yes stop_codon:yes gene_type:complete
MFKLNNLMVIVFLVLSSFASAEFKLKSGDVIKSGEVLSSDGMKYEGMSPKTKRTMIQKAKKGGDQVGTHLDSLFMVVEDEIITIPLADLANKSDKQIDRILDKAFEKLEIPKINQLINKTKAEAKGKTKDKIKAIAKDKAKATAKDKAKAAAKDKAKATAKDKAKAVATDKAKDLRSKKAEKTKY